MLTEEKKETETERERERDRGKRLTMLALALLSGLAGRRPSFYGERRNVGRGRRRGEIHSRG